MSLMGHFPLCEAAFKGGAEDRCRIPILGSPLGRVMEGRENERAFFILQGNLCVLYCARKE